MKSILYLAGSTVNSGTVRDQDWKSASLKLLLEKQDYMRRLFIKLRDEGCFARLHSCGLRVFSIVIEGTERHVRRCITSILQEHPELNWKEEVAKAPAPHASAHLGRNGKTDNLQTERGDILQSGAKLEVV